MRVEAIEQTRSPQGKLRVRFDNGESLLILPAAIAELGLYAGMELPDAAMDSIKETCGAASARERAVRIVSAASVTKKELRHRLVQKGETEEHADEAVKWLSELHLLLC